MSADRARIEKACAILSTLPEGAALIELAAQRGCDIVLSDKVAYSGELELLTPVVIDIEKYKFRLENNAQAQFRILISPSCTDAELPVIIAHELRHLWQREFIPQEKMLNLSVPLDMAMNRVLEGDAYTFQWYVEDRLNGVPAEKFDWKGAFDHYQQSKTSLAYDRAQIDRSSVRFAAIQKLMAAKAITEDHAHACAAGIFNRHSLADLSGLSGITKAGIHDTAQDYMGGMSAFQLLRHAQSYGAPEDFELAQRCMRQLHPDLAKHHKNQLAKGRDHNVNTV